MELPTMKLRMSHRAGSRSIPAPRVTRISLQFPGRSTSVNSSNSRSRFRLFVVLVLLSTAAWAQDQGPVFRWSGKLAADKVVSIKNVNGNVDAQTIAGDQIQVTAEKSGRDSDQVRIEVVPFA